MRAIVLTSTQFSDSSFITNLYTDEVGIVAVSVRTGGKRSKFRHSYLMPLTLLDIELSGRERKEIRYVGDCSLAYNCQTLSSDPVKMLEAQFLAEILQKSLRSSEADVRTFDFLSSSIIEMDRDAHTVSDCHLRLLVRLMSYIGIMPDFTNFLEDSVLDISEGKMVVMSSGDYLSHELSACLMRLANGDETSLTSQQRRDLIDFIVKYYQCHLSGFGIIKTLEMFREL